MWRPAWFRRNFLEMVRNSSIGGNLQHMEGLGNGNGKMPMENSAPQWLSLAFGIAKIAGILENGYWKERIGTPC
jgi:hypothetical protein